MSLPEEYMSLIGVLSVRYSCRGFRPDPLPDAVIEAIVNAARHTPSWCNAQPWQLTITRGAETEAFRTALMAEAETQKPQPDLDWPKAYTGVYQERRRTCGWQLYEAVGVPKGDRAASAREMMKNFSFFGAPHVAIVTSPADLGPYGALDCGGFITAFTLAAQALGVATIPQAAVASFAPLIHAHFGIPDDRMVICGISLGYADTTHPANQFRTGRANVDDIIDWRG